LLHFEACILAVGSVNSGHHPRILIGKRCDDESHSKSTSCEMNQKHPCIMRQLWECARVLASLSASCRFQMGTN
jgi:hypothetical protein